MNRKHLMFVVSLLVPLLASCRVDPSAPAHATETEIARFATAAAAFDATVTAAAASLPTSAETPAATPTDTQLPSATPSSTATPSPTSTPTEEPPVPDITDVCSILDENGVGTLLGVKIVREQNVAQKDSYVRCFWTSADARAGVTLSIAQNKTAVDLLVTGFAEINEVKACAKPVPVSADAVKKARLYFEGLGIIRPSGFFTEPVKLIEEKGCTEKYGVQAISGLGDVAVAEHIYDYSEVGAVLRNTLFYSFAYGPAITPAEAVDIDEKVLDMVIKHVRTMP